MMSAQRGSTKLDVGVLSAEQREKLRQFKIATRIDNEEYLKSHPEVQLLIGDFLRQVLLKRPDDIREFAADHFTNSNLRSAYDSKREVNTDME
ncbi:RIIa domain-containing protein 1 isoform X1 [Betta splendens]|uniref:RIIa domain-containing protein 1 isoform X1 n=1 Tax=Betta splendens TaxID=158456 RepID=A0A6P7KX43_BETSP|nr:RIIa domain-containing protein 1 isoform X1 [Betta splendens]